MAVIVLDNFGGLESDPTADVIAPGKSPLGWNYRLHPAGPGGRGMRVAPGRTRVYRASLEPTGLDRVALLLAEPSDFNADKGVVLLATDSGESGRVATIHHHQDISGSVFEPPFTAGANMMIHEHYTRIKRYALDEEQLYDFARGYYYPTTHGLYPDDVAEHVTLPAAFLKWMVHVGGLVGTGVGGRVTIVDHHLGAVAVGTGVPSGYTGPPTGIRHWEHFQVAEFDSYGGVRQTTHREQLSMLTLADTSPRGRPTEMLAIGNSLLFVSNGRLLRCVPGALIYDQPATEDDFWGGGAEVVGSICAHNTTATDFLVGLWNEAPSIYHMRLTGSGAMSEVAEIQAFASGDYKIDGIDKIIPINDGSGYLVFGSDYDGLRTGDAYDATNKKVILLGNDLVPTAYVDVATAGRWTSVGCTGTLGVCIGFAPQGADEVIHVYDPSDLSLLATLSLSGSYDKVKGIVQYDGKFWGLAQTGRYDVQSYGDSVEDLWNATQAARFDTGIAKWGADYVLDEIEQVIDEGGPVAFVN